MNQKTKTRYGQEKGITLIALVITIIVLLILAGVTISMVLGDDGIIQNAQQATNSTKKASVKEELTIIGAELTLEKYGTGVADLDSKNAEGIIKRLEEKGIAKSGELEARGAYAIGYTDDSNTTTYSLRDILPWDNSEDRLNIEEDVEIRVDGVKDPAYKTEIKSIIIPQGATWIASTAFRGCTSLISVDIPNTVTSISDGAFEGCTSLKNVNMPDSLIEIGICAFEGCTSLVNVNIQMSGGYIGPDAFTGCTSLKNVNISEGVQGIHYEAFSNCTALESIYIPNSISQIGTPGYEDDLGVFYGCTNLKQIIFQSGNTTYNKDTVTAEMAESWGVTLEKIVFE